MWISPAAANRLEGQTGARGHGTAPVDHEAATQPCGPGNGGGQRSPIIRGQQLPKQTAREESEVELTTQDAEQTEHYQRQRWAEEYERQLADEAAEALYLADLQWIGLKKLTIKPKWRSTSPMAAQCQIATATPELVQQERLRDKQRAVATACV